MYCLFGEVSVSKEQIIFTTARLCQTSRLSHTHKRMRCNCNQHRTRLKKDILSTHIEGCFNLEEVKSFLRGREEKKKTIYMQIKRYHLNLFMPVLSAELHSHKGIRLLLQRFSSSLLSIFYLERQPHVHLIGSRSVSQL